MNGLTQIKPKIKSKHLIWLFSVAIVILFGYWVKCQIGLDFFGSCSLSDIPPFKHLQKNNILADPEPGILLADSFESKKIVSNWSELWMREKGKVTQSYDSNGFSNSRCLFIDCNSKKSWSFALFKLVEVEKGDIFSFKGVTKINGNGTAYMGISIFDEGQTAIKWNYIKVKVVEHDKWITVEKRFTITDDIKYIRFRLTGVGVGEYRFDDIVFRKEGRGAERGKVQR